MILGDVDFPDHLVASIATGSCVIFAGAGVSKAPPAGLPLFAELAEMLAGKAPPSGEALDRFIGRLGERQDLVDRTVAIIQASRGPNSIHESLVKLFCNANKIRIVTTNYDMHFEAATRQVFSADPVVFHAPALPLGREFHGVVHVHGSTSHSNGIVLTDADFGRAYLTEGWARRYLVDLFQHWDVLFVGYSHDDTIMDYLARALPPASRQRYALVPGDAQIEKWQHRGIKAITFGTASRASDFAIQSNALGELSLYLGRTAIEWAAHMSRAVMQGPPLDKAAISQLVHSLKRPLQCRLFVEQHPKAEWLDWLDDQGLIQALSEDLVVEDPHRLLSRWIAHEVLPRRPDAVLGWMTRKGKVSSLFWHDMAFGVRELTEATDMSLVKSLLGFLAYATPDRADSFHLRLLSEVAAKFSAIDVIIEIFKRSSQSWPRFQERERHADGGMKRESHVEPQLKLERHHLDDIIDDLRPSLDTCAPRLFPLVCEAIQQRHAIHSRWGGAAPAFDSDSFGRAAIEPHDQDRFDDDCDPLIDLCRDILDRWIVNDVSMLRSWVATALASPIPLLCRLALYGLTKSPGQDPNSAVAMLIKGPLTDVWCRHEVFVVLRAFYGNCGDDIRREVLRRLQEHTEFNPEAPDEESAHAYYQWVYDLAEHSPQCQLAEEACRFIKSVFPNFIAREYPDLTHWTSSGWGGDPSPLSASQLTQMTAEELIADEITRVKDARSGRDLSSYYEAITNASENDPGWGDRLMHGVLGNRHESERLREAILRSLSKRLEHAEQLPSAMTMFEDPRHFDRHLTLLCSLLRRLTENDPQPHIVSALPRFDNVAAELWKRARPDGGTNTDSTDWNMAALNSAAGTLADYVVTSISIQCRVAEGADPVPIPIPLKSLVTDMLSAPPPSGGMCRTSIASQVGYFLWLDGDLTKSLILPLFESDDAPTKAQAWQGFLGRGRMYPALAQAMRPAIECLITGDLGAVAGEMHAFAAQLILAGEMISGDMALSWMLHPSALRNDALRRAIAAQSLSLCRGVPLEVLIKCWSGWLSRYWITRAEDRQFALDGEEVGVYLDALDDLEPVFDEATAVLERMPHPALQHVHILHGIHNEGMDVKYPESSARILRYILSCERAQWALFQADEVLKAIVPRLRDERQRRSLVDLAIQQNAIRSDEGLALLDPKKGSS